MITTDPTDKIELRNLDEHLLISIAQTVLFFCKDFESISDMLDDDGDDDDDGGGGDENDIEVLNVSLSLYIVDRL